MGLLNCVPCEARVLNYESFFNSQHAYLCVYPTTQVVSWPGLGTLVSLWNFVGEHGQEGVQLLLLNNTITDIQMELVRETNEKSKRELFQEVHPLLAMCIAPIFWCRYVLTRKSTIVRACSPI